MNAIEPQPTQKPALLAPDITTAIQDWGNSIWRPTVPTDLISKSLVTAVADERAKLLTAQFLYGERTGTEKEVPYDGHPIRNSTDDLGEESLWLYGGDSAAAPTGFSEASQDKFTISTGVTKKCPRCKGDGKVNCFICRGTGRGDTDKSKHCQHCHGTGKTPCGTCDGYRYVEVLLQVKTRFKVHETKKPDYQGQIPHKRITATTGALIFEETANYPQAGMKDMLKGGIDRQEYAKLQVGVANIFHSLVTQKLQTYDGDIMLLHTLVDKFFKQIPDAFHENRVLEHEILPIRVRFKVEDVPVKKVFYTYKDKPYTLWVYGKENKVYAPKRPLAITRRLVVSWIIQLLTLGLVVYWFSTSRPGPASNSQPPLEASSLATPGATNAASAADLPSPEAQTAHQP